MVQQACACSAVYGLHRSADYTCVCTGYKYDLEIDSIYVFSSHTKIIKMSPTDTLNDCKCGFIFISGLYCQSIPSILFVSPFDSDFVLSKHKQ